MLVLSTLVVLGTITFLRCLQIAVDDWDFGERIRRLRGVYAELLPPSQRKWARQTARNKPS